MKFFCRYRAIKMFLIFRHLQFVQRDFFEHNLHFKLTNGNLLIQLGGEVLYNTPYHGYSYMPATGRFYRQTNSLTGNYPYLTAFLNIKLKRTRIFLMLDHFNSGMSGYDYFMVPSYPMNIRMFKIWTGLDFL